MSYYSRGIILRLALAIFGFILLFEGIHIKTGSLRINFPAFTNTSRDYTSPNWSNDYDNSWDSGWSIDTGDSGWDSGGWDSGSWDSGGGDSGSWDSGGGDSGSW